MIEILDKGYVKLVETNMLSPVLGNDASSANAARASFAKFEPGLTERNKRLLNFLAKEDHTSPYRHAAMTFEIKAPLMVARQWFKYRIGSTHGPDTAELLGVSVPEEWREEFFDYVSNVLGYVGQGDDGGFGSTFHGRNEASRRYVTSTPEFYIPTAWRRAPENKKQGSGEAFSPELEISGEMLDIGSVLNYNTDQCVQYYEQALAAGVCAEQARLFLPMYGLYTSWWWTGSVQAIAYFLLQRHPDFSKEAQVEIQDYAKGIADTAIPIFEYSLGGIMNAKKELS